MITLLLADDQALVRGAMAALLGMEEDIDVVADVGSGDEVLEAVRRTEPDIAVLDIEMPGLDGIAATEQLAREAPGTRVLIVTTFGRPGYLRRALEAGARGFVVKDTPSDELAEAVRTVAKGGRVVDPSLATDVVVGGPNPLTDREQEVLRYALEGHSAPVIAANVHLSPGTVRNHISSAIGKTGMGTKVEAARRAQDLGWL